DRLGSPAGHGLATLRVVEYEGQLRAVKRAWSAVEHRGLPGEPVQIRRRGVLSRFALALLDRGCPDRRGGDTRPDVEGLCVRRALPERGGHLLRSIAVGTTNLREHLLLGHELAVGMIDVREELVEIRADDHRNACRDLRRN